MRSTGMVLTGVAIGELILGTALFGVGTSAANNCGGACPASTDKVVGATLIVTSIVFAAIGIPLWIVGSRPFREDTASASAPVRIVRSATGIHLAF